MTVRQAEAQSKAAVAANDSSVTGWRPLLRFMLRRERFTLPWWLLGSTLLFLVQSTQSQRLYDTPEKLARQRETVGGNAAAIALSGPKELLGSIGGEVVFEIFAYLAVVVALMSMFLVGRHTRADEETGRAELIRSARVGRHAPMAAALALAALADLVVGLLVFAAAAGTGLPVGGSLLVGVALAGVGLTFAALTGVAAQLFYNARAVYGAVSAAVGAAFILRAIGDVGNGALSWLSPIGWGQRTFPYIADRWWPLLIPLVVTGLLVVLAVALMDRRDFAAGMLPTRPGRPTASWALRSPYGLAWRLQRVSLFGWAIGILVLAAAYGSFGDSIEEYVADNPEIADYLPGGASDVVDSYLALTIGLCALLAAAFAVASTLRLRGEETSARAEPVLATATSRWSWLASHLAVAVGGSTLAVAAAGFGHGLAYGLTVSDLGQVPRLTVLALAYLPAVWVLVGLTVVALGWLPRASAAVAWAAVGFCAVVALFGDSFNLPQWLQDISPFTQSPQAPLDSVHASPLLVLSSAAIVLILLGYAGLRRRDLGY